MKKLLAVLLVFALAISVAVTVSATGDTTKVTAEWKKLHGNTDVTKTTEGGTTVYTFGGIEAAYHSASVNLFSDLQSLIKGKSSITVKVTMNAKIAYNEGYEDEEFPVTMLIRVGGRTSLVASMDSFKANFKEKVESSSIASIDGSNIGIVFEQKDYLTGEWATIETPEFEITPDDLNTEFWTQLNLCFHRMNDFEICKSISIKNTSIVIVDGTTGSDKPTIDNSNADSGNSGDTVVGNGEDTPELPEGNFLTATWGKGLGATTISTGEFNGQTTHVFKGMNNSYASPYLNIYDAVKSAMGGEEDVTLWFVLDVRVANKASNAGKEHKFGMKIRPTKAGKILNAEDALDSYDGSMFNFATGGVNKTILGSSDMTLSENWQRIEIDLIVTSDDINDEVFDAWNVCFDNMDTFADIVEIQVKNAGIFLEDAYEPIEVEEEEEDEGGAAITTTPKPVTIYKPYNYDKYQVTFRDAVSSESTPAPTPDANGNIPTVTDGVQVSDSNQDSGSNAIIIAVVAVSVIVLAGAVAIFFILKTKKGGKAE